MEHHNAPPQTPADTARARLVEDLRRAKALGHNVQAWKIKATLAGFDMALDAVRAEERAS